MKKLTLLIGLVCALAVTSYAQNTSTGGEFNGLKNTVKQYHITTNTTNTPVTSNIRLYGITYNCSNAGTAWTLTVKDKQGTPAIVLATGSLTQSTTPVTTTIPIPGILLTGGVDIVTAGTTPGVLDLWLSYR